MTRGNLLAYSRYSIVCFHAERLLRRQLVVLMVLAGLNVKRQFRLIVVFWRQGFDQNLLERALGSIVELFLADDLRYANLHFGVPKETLAVYRPSTISVPAVDDFLLTGK